jgi:kynurenine formamidase
MGAVLRLVSTCILLEKGVVIIESLNLLNVTPGEYQLICLPLKLVGSDGAPARAVLIENQHLFKPIKPQGMET